MPLPAHIANEIARLMRDPDALRHERGRMPSSDRHDHFDPNQPRVPAGQTGGGQWTSAGGNVGANFNHVEQPQLAQFAPDGPSVRPGPLPPGPVVPGPIRPGPGGPGLISALLSLYAALSARNTRENRAVFEFNARQYLADPDGELSRANVATLNRDQVRRACPGLREVQGKTDVAATHVLGNGGWSMSPQQFGTAVHKRLKDVITSSPGSNLQAEVSRVKGDDANQTYGTKDSVRIDVLECADARTACVYDIKTGESRSGGLSPRRMRELALHALKACPKTERVVVTEVRPSQ